MAASLKHFISQIVESSVLSAAEIAEFQQAQTIVAETAEDFAKQLVQQKKLTKYQSQLINQGKGDSLLLGNHVILNVIGVGGMGQVFLAEHRRMKRRVALKTLPPELTGNEQAIRRFHREVQAAAKLTHPNIVTAFDADEDKGIHYFAMEYVSGIDLADNVRSHGVLSVSRAVDYILQAAKGLEYAHRKGVIHRDIKPANMLLDHEGTVKILDMGLARVDNTADEKAATALTQAGNMMGTVDYMAPEQARDSHTADARSDIYSLGCTLHYLLTAESVYSGDTLVNRILAHRDHPVPSLTTKLGHVPASLDAVFQKMVAKEPTDRYQTVGEVIRDIQACGLLDQSDSSATIRTEPVDPALTDFLNSQTEDVTRTLVMADEVPPVRNGSDTLQSGFLDNTLSGGAPVTGKKSRKSADKRVWIVTSVALAAVLILVGLFLNRDSAKGTLVLEIDQPELAGAVVSVDGQNRITIQSGDEPKSIEIAADGKQHSLKVTKEGFATFTQQVAVSGGSKRTIRVRLEPLNVVPQSSPTTDMNYALEFDGKSSYVDLPVNYGGRGPITFELYVKPLSFPKASSTPLGTWVYGLQFHTEGPRTFWENAANISQIVDTQAHGYVSYCKDNATLHRRVHIAGVRDGGELRLFVDGTEFSKQVTFGDPAVPLAEADIRQGRFSLGVTIGREQGKKFVSDRFFHGIIDEVRVSNIARYTTDFIPTKRFAPDKNTLALYHFDEGQGDVLKDVSGNGHHGTIVGAKWVKVDDDLQVIDAPTTDPHRRAAEMVLRLGGSVTYVTPTAMKTITELSQLPPERFALFSVNLTDCDALSDADWQTLAGVKHLIDLNYTGAPISLAALKALRQVGSIHSLNLSYTELNDAGVAQLEALEDVQGLSLGGNSTLTSAAFDSIAKISTLRELHLSPTTINTAGLKSLAKLHRLRSLSISHSTGLSGSSLAELSPLQSLQVLELIDTDVNDAALPSLTELQSLRLLDLVKTDVTNAAAVRLQTLLPNCSIIHPAVPTSDADQRAAQWAVDSGGRVRIITTTRVGHETFSDKVIPEGPFAVSRITFNSNILPPAALANLDGLRSIVGVTLPTLGNPDNALASCKDLTSLLSVNFDTSDVTAKGLAQLQGLSQLEQLSLITCKNVSDDALATLLPFKHLWRLSLSYSPMTDVGLGHIGRLQSLRQLSLTQCPNLTGSGLEHLVPMPRLNHLSLGHTPITDDAIPHLQKMQRLRVLDLTGTKITAAAAARLQTALPDCVVFHESLNDVPWSGPPKRPAVILSDPQRRVAEMLLRQGEKLSILTTTGGLQAQQITSLQQLPRERFALYEVYRNQGNPLSAAEWVDLKRIKSLDRLLMLNAPTSAAVFKQLKELSSLRHLERINVQLTEEKLAQIAEVADLQELNLLFCPDITDKSCDSILKLAELRELQITGTSITGTGLKKLAKLPNLFSLQLSLSNGIAAADLAVLQSLESLNSLILWQPDVDDKVIEHLEKLKSLRLIRFAQTNVTKEGAARLQQLLPECTILHPAIPTAPSDLKSARWVIENGGSLWIHTGPYIPYRKLPPEPFALNYIGLPATIPLGPDPKDIEGIRSLETLACSKLPAADAALASIGKLTTLRRLYISQSNVSAMGLSHLKEMGHLETLDLSSCGRLSDDALVHLGKIKLLRSLTLNQTPVTDNGLAALGQLPNLWDLRLKSCPNITGSGLADLVTPLKLRRLSFIGSPVTDDAIPHLQQMQSLRVLHITNTLVTAAAAAKLQAALPDCVVFHESLANVPWRAGKNQ